jgi:diguanylate cyclase (GGDEF)-like protein/PAS domain S-box-containing protein
MKDEEKTKKQLINELAELRQRLIELEIREMERKKREEALWEGERRFHQMAENIPAVLWMVDPSMTQCFYISPAYEKIWGRTCESFYKDPKSFLEAILPEDRGRVVDSLARLMEGRADLDEEFRILRPDGSIRWVQNRAFRVWNERGELSGLTGSMEDITERKQTETNLREQTEVVETINCIGQILSAELDLQKVVQALTDAATELTGAAFGSFFYNVTDERGESYLLYTLSGAPREAFGHFPMPHNTDLFGPTFCGEGVIRIADVKKDPRYGKNPPYYGMPPGHLPVTSYLAVPVISRSGEVLGGLFFGHPEAGVFTERHERIVVGLAAQAAIAIDNARLFELVQNERTRAEATQKQIANILESIADGFCTFDKEWRITYLNQEAQKLLTRLQLTHEKVLNKNVWELFPHLGDSIVYEQFHRAITEQVRVEFEYFYPPLNSWFEVRAYPSKEGLTVYFQDITERKRTEETIKQLAYFDALTGLPNRTLFNDRLNLALAQASRDQQMLALIFLDLDRFKTINDTLGHTLGDRLLQEIAKRLVGCLRRSDTVSRFGSKECIISRLGGDEFTILLPRIHQVEDAARIAQRILDTLKPPFYLDGHELHITTSLGIAFYPNDGKDAQTLLKNADAAMYRAKEWGRNSYRFYTSTMNAKALERLVLEAQLRHTVEREEFAVYYQPQVNLKTGKMVGVEALIRWQHPELGLVLPGNFIRLAEETGLITSISKWVLKTACTQNKAWQQAGLPPIRVAVNLSARIFRQENLIDTVAHTLQETQLDPGYLELELTEDTIMEDAEEAIGVLHQLKEMGVNLSIDDFGKGYSSLSYLKRFPIDTLKIDQSFVKDIPGDPEDTTIARLIIDMAHALELKVLAEGVETEEQLFFFVCSTV